MLTLNKITISGEEITDEDLFLEYKRTYLILQRALLKNGLSEEMVEVGKSYEKLKETINGEKVPLSRT
uniref:Uncharacterized protein n=1 Tax=viral metagenome TaxID=1070528 RepID=A0A6H1ZET5_9ZZZZ